MRALDLSGKLVGHLKCIRPVSTNKWGSIVWECLCECGAAVLRPASGLTSVEKGKGPHCGCKTFQRTSERATKHGMSHKPEWNIWMGMRTRGKATTGLYANVKVCERWNSSFQEFYKDMGPRPTPDHSIDRINNLGDYEPSNCRWATTKEQANNRSSNALFSIGGIAKTIAQWADESGLQRRCLEERAKRRWPEHIFLAPPGSITKANRHVR